MESRKSIGKQMQQLIEGRGFYIVIAICAAIIGVSIWSLLKPPAEHAPDESEFDEVLSDVIPEDYKPVEPILSEEETEAEPESNDTADKMMQETASEQTPVWPVEGEIQRDYSTDALQYDLTMSDWRTHDGLDISAETGTKVTAIRSGTVTKVYSDDLYGTCVIIDHGNGLEISYGNLEQVPTVYEGDSVSAGDIIGSVGDTAKCESAQGSHLHLSAKMNGSSVSPIDYLPKKS